jgi:hypothetical protein
MAQLHTSALGFLYAAYVLAIALTGQWLMKGSRGLFLFPALAWIFYASVFLLTPYDLPWHLTTAASRVLAHPAGSMAIIVAAALTARTGAPLIETQTALPVC